MESIAIDRLVCRVDQLERIYVIVDNLHVVQYNQYNDWIRVYFIFYLPVCRKMKFLFVLAFVALAAAYPQREGAAFSNEAIKQAQSTFLIPKDAEIQRVSLCY